MVAAGSEFEVQFHGSMRQLRGALWQLSKGETSYDLIASDRADVAPKWSATPVYVADQGRHGPSDWLIIPPVAAPGVYTLCAVQSADSPCATITVTAQP